jgi:hypothetical protein
VSSLPEESARQASRPARWAGAFGRFWWDFLVGDTPELFAGALIVIGVVALLQHLGLPRPVVVAALPVLTAGLLALTLTRAWRARRR